MARTPADVLATKAGDAAAPAPKAGAKWVTASVVQDAATVIAKVFDEAQRRDPSHARRWVALVDGNNHQIDRIQAEASTRGVDVAAGIRRRATAAQLSKQKRTKADACAKYLTNKAEYLDYPSALAAGWPVASGVIEGTCRYLVAVGMDITGARWSVNGAEAVLKLRAVRANDDIDDYWKFHLDMERHRVHELRYADPTPPRAA